MTGNDEYKDIKNPIVRWLASQGIVSFLLVVIIVGGYYSLDWAMKEGVPMHLKMIQDGYDRCDAKHEQQLDKVIDSFEREMQRMIQRGAGAKPDFSSIAEKDAD